MRFFLRTKLFALVIASIALATIPIIALTYTKLQQASIDFEQRSFGNMVLLVEDSISSRYLNLLTNEVVEVLQRKQQLQRTAMLARSTWNDTTSFSSDVRTNVLKNWAAPLMTFNMYLELFTKGEAQIQTPLLVGLANTPQRRGFKGQSFQDMLDIRKHPAEGTFAVFTLTEAESRAVGIKASEGTQAVLVYFLPVPEQKSVIAVAMLISSIMENSTYSKQQMVTDMQVKFDTLQMYHNGYIALVSGSGKLLAHKGAITQEDVKKFPAEALRKARARRTAEGLSDSLEPSATEEVFVHSLDSTLFCVVYFKALDWYAVAAVPKADIEEAANTLVHRLIIVALVTLLVSMLVTLLVTAHMTRPLQLLTRKALALAKTEFTAFMAPPTVVQNAEPDQTSPAASLQSLARDLPVKGTDEVSQLARAFALMLEALDENIRKLMETKAIQAHMQGELNAAHDIQMGILPAADDAPQQAGYLAAAFIEPAKEVGGDLYDFFVAPDGRQIVVIGDVSGKGVPAALFMSMVVTLIRYAMASGLAPATAMGRINDCLSEKNASCMFVTLFIGIFDPKTGRLDYANGGHCPPMLVNAQERTAVRIIEDMSGPLVGAMPGMAYEARQAQLMPGDLCLLYTDGVSEAMNEAQEFFGEARLESILDQHRADGPRAVLDAIYGAVLDYRGNEPQSDDITMLCFMRQSF